MQIERKQIATSNTLAVNALHIKKLQAQKCIGECWDGSCVNKTLAEIVKKVGYEFKRNSEIFL